MVKHHNDNRPLLREFLDDGLGCCRRVFNALAGVAVFWIVAGIAVYVVLEEYMNAFTISQK